LAIDISKNKKYLKYALVPLIIILIILFTSPAMLTSSANRLLMHSKYFEKQAPFTFVIKNKDLKAIQQDDFVLNVKMEGDEIPENIFIEIDGGSVPAYKREYSEFSSHF